MIGFLDLPPELRIIVYDCFYDLATPEKPEELISPAAAKSGAPGFLSLWRTCKALAAEGPRIADLHHLMKREALVPVLDIYSEDLIAEWEQSLSYLTPFLRHAPSFRIRGPDQYSEFGSPQTYPQAAAAFDRWIGEWRASAVAKKAMDAWLAPRSHGPQAETKELLFLTDVLRLYVNIDFDPMTDLGPAWPQLIRSTRPLALLCAVRPIHLPNLKRIAVAYKLNAKGPYIHPGTILASDLAHLKSSCSGAVDERSSIVWRKSLGLYFDLGNGTFLAGQGRSLVS